MPLRSRILQVNSQPITGQAHEDIIALLSGTNQLDMLLVCEVNPATAPVSAPTTPIPIGARASRASDSSIKEDSIFRVLPVTVRREKDGQSFGFSLGFTSQSHSFFK